MSLCVQLKIVTGLIPRFSTPEARRAYDKLLTEYEATMSRLQELIPVPDGAVPFAAVGEFGS